MPSETQSLEFNIPKQYLKYSGRTWDGKKLHRFQVAFLDDALDEITIVEAPTGAGKTFAFGLISASEKEKCYLDRLKKTLVVAPTKILAEQIKSDIENLYSAEDHICVQVINSDTLNQLGEDVKNLKRWRAILNISDEPDFIIITPDLLNYIITSGYQHFATIDFTKTTESFLDFFQKFTHIVIDEFHLYDAEQIANILIWQKVNEVSISDRKPKLVFVSATPTKILQEYLENQSLKFSILSEEVCIDSNGSRVFHGDLTVKIISIEDPVNTSLFEYVNKVSVIQNLRISAENKLLIIYNSLRQLQLDRVQFESIYSHLGILEISGYDRTYRNKNSLDEFGVLMGTSAVEQGVNLKVNNAIILSGYTPESLIQRFGRVARGEVSGNITILLSKDQFRKLQELNPQSRLDINQFITFIKQAYDQPPLLNTEKIDYFKGAFWFIIRKRQNNYFLKNLLKEVFVSENSSCKYTYHLLNSLDKAIQSLQHRSNRRLKSELTVFFDNFLSTFQYFRSSSAENIKVFDKDLNIFTEYAKDWIYKNKEVTLQKDGLLEVENLTENDLSVVEYTIDSLPWYANCPVTMKQKEIRINPINSFEIHLSTFFNDSALNERISRGYDSEALRKIADLLLRMKVVINPKRFRISDVRLVDEKTLILQSII